MKVALVTDVYAPRLGGIENQVAGLAQALTKHGCAVTVLTSTPRGRQRGDYTRTDRGVTVRRLTLDLPARLPYNPFAADQLRVTLPEFDLIHIHCSTISPLGITAANLCAELRLPTVVTWHSMMTDSPRIFAAANPLKRWAEGGLTLTAVSLPAAEVITEITGVEVGVLPNSIDTEPWASARRRRLSADETAEQEVGVAAPLRVVTACRLVRRKRAESLVSAVSQARERGANIQLEIFGDGPRRYHLHRLSRRVPMRLRGRVDAEHLADAYVSADVFASPVQHEAFGIAALEAHSAGLPVLHWRGAGISEFVTDGRDGIAVSSDAELAQALWRLDRDRGLLDRLRRAALNSATGSWQENLDGVTTVYEATVKRSRH